MSDNHTQDCGGNLFYSSSCDFTIQEGSTLSMKCTSFDEDLLTLAMMASYMTAEEALVELFADKESCYEDIFEDSRDLFRR